LGGDIKKQTTQKKGHEDRKGVSWSGEAIFCGREEHAARGGRLKLEGCLNHPDQAASNGCGNNQTNSKGEKRDIRRKEKETRRDIKAGSVPHDCLGKAARGGRFKLLSP